MARVGTAEERADFLDALTSLVVNVPTVHDSDAVTYQDIVLKFLPSLPLQRRSQLSNRVSEWKALPHALAVKIATDETPVAVPVLQRSPVLTALDLVGFAERLDDAHRTAIAQRKNLESAVCQALVRNGGRDVHCALAGNVTAQLSQADLGRLVSEALGDGELASMLVRRSDLAQAEAQRLIAPMAKFMKARFARRRADRAPPPPPPPPPQKQRTVAELVADLEAGRTTLDAVTTDLVDSDRTTDLAAVLSALSGFDEVSIVRVMMREDAAGIALVCKALEMGEAAYRHIAAFRVRKLGLDKAHVTYETDDYRKLDVKRCRKTLEQLRGHPKH